MTDPARNVFEAALELDEAEQEEIIEALSAILNGSDLGPEWEAEIQRRISEVITTPMPARAPRLHWKVK
jgi:hypothetical protein